MARNPFVRFLNNNLAAATGVTATYSSAKSGFPGANALDPMRYRRWIWAGRFAVTATNNKIYIADGSNFTATLTVGNYLSGTLMAAQIQTQLNAVSTLWTCTYSTTTFKFTIGRSSGTATLRLTQTTNAAWSMLGYLGAADTATSTGLAADAARNHTTESVIFDLGAAKQCRAFCVIGPTDTDFALSSSAVSTLQANNVNDFTAPPLSVTLTPESTGIFQFLDDQALGSTYRYWKWETSNPTNTLGPELPMHHVYLGDYAEVLAHNVVGGFQRKLVDPSEFAESAAGVLYARKRAKYWTYTGTKVDYLSGADRVTLESLMRTLGGTTPFYVSLDPTVTISQSVGEFTKYMLLDSSSSIQHVLYNLFNVTLGFREVI